MKSTPSGLKYPFTLEKSKQTREIKDYADLLDLFDWECPEAPVNEQEEPDADEMMDLLRADGWRVIDNL